VADEEKQKHTCSIVGGNEYWRPASARRTKTNDEAAGDEEAHERGEVVRLSRYSPKLHVLTPFTMYLQATFEPKIATKNSKLAPSTDGHLRILSDPESYVDRVRSRTHAMNTKTRRVQQHADLKEYAECTFHPQTKKVPKYITRISQTMKMAKELRKQQGLDDSAKKPERPEWR